MTPRQLLQEMTDAVAARREECTGWIWDDDECLADLDVAETWLSRLNGRLLDAEAGDPNAITAFQRAAKGLAEWIEEAGGPSFGDKVKLFVDTVVVGSAQDLRDVGATAGKAIADAAPALGGGIGLGLALLAGYKLLASKR